MLGAVNGLDRSPTRTKALVATLLSTCLLSACTSANTDRADPSSAPTAGSHTSAEGNRTVYGEFIFRGRDRLVTNEFAHWNPQDPQARTSPDWAMTSGSLFLRSGVAYSGRPDRGQVDATSSRAMNSAVFRLVTKNRMYGDVRLTLRFRLLRFTQPSGDPVDDWNGLHLWLRYQDHAHLYVASVARRDDTATIKRKDPGGDSNDGHYTTLASRRAPVSLQAWHTATATIRTVEGAVHLTLDVDGSRVLDAVDGADGTPLLDPGGLGIRADNVEFEFANVRVDPLNGP